MVVFMNVHSPVPKTSTPPEETPITAEKKAKPEKPVLPSVEAVTVPTGKVEMAQTETPATNSLVKVRLDNIQLSFNQSRPVKK